MLLLALALDRASFQGLIYVPVQNLLEPATPTPPITFGATPLIAESGPPGMADAGAWLETSIGTGHRRWRDENLDAVLSRAVDELKMLS